MRTQNKEYFEFCCMKVKAAYEKLLQDETWRRKKCTSKMYGLCEETEFAHAKVYKCLKALGINLKDLDI